ncbi:biotin-dependent carboxyltransferase [Roseovarius spongiae]|uniref:Biotin-dependent carboxyltransferase n=1 Tax=Roseovarius spongiae TaxID=2320272 RepID=A0A3A8BBG0_9RHOB|nr:biotin-dependent carboxyltransferase family protein [Roseovarius spongiae]RKF16754.1 biotin-dependent carboxyltransferase [Roseovarius spongiae]
MTRRLIIHRAGPGVTLQDLGRPGWLAQGLSRGGAADRVALAEGAALLEQPVERAALEMAGAGGEFEAGEDMRIALTGAPMRASVDGAQLAWNASHLLPAGARLSIGAAQGGNYGYLHVGGGFATEVMLGARAVQNAAGLGAPLRAGDELPVGADDGARTGMTLDAENRFGGGAVRIIESFQSRLFDEAERERLEATELTRDARGNRMGVRLEPDGEGFHASGGRSVLSEVIMPGDIQITGDGTPFVLMSECQTTGGYPRIGTVLPCDLPRVAQAPAGARLRFRFVTLDEAVEAERKARDARAGLTRNLRPLVRDPHRMPDLLSYQLISGVTAGDDLA